MSVIMVCLTNGCYIHLVHFIKVETSVMKSEELAQENSRLHHEIKNLNARLRHAESTSVDPR